MTDRVFSIGHFVRHQHPLFRKARLWSLQKARLSAKGARDRDKCFRAPILRLLEHLPADETQALSASYFSQGADVGYFLRVEFPKHFLLCVYWVAAHKNSVTEMRRVSM